MTEENVPPNVRKRLAAELKALRGERRQEDVVRALLEIPGSGSWSASKLSKVENNQARVQPDEVEDLLAVFGVRDEELLSRLKLWAKAARRKGRWQQHGRDLPESIRDFVEYEELASVQRVWEPLLVPAMCQTAGYAASVILGLERSITEEELQRRVDARLRRQVVLDREDPQELWVLLDERVLRGVVGPREVRVEQLHHLVNLAARDNVTLQVVAAGAGPHPGLTGWFSLMEFPDDSADIAYTDGVYGSLYLEDPEDVRGCTLVFGHLLGIALTTTESVALIHRVIGELTQEPQ
ncbi:helix-turn-helix domain-containing protein [Saccharothrix obliqua]|uniref:helix-turn-helix domain-containing protein n=1 Tax=Saccharothrix obliqua TaxID=2861747 RepID=UPI001C5E2263|nr:helix-turn-helix transcriptional regulator [Saccharothrix obliqua]MBW4719606.1 helix-turn-helix transcriptional regulator [Saccharothrix obliqua]